MIFLQIQFIFWIVNVRIDFYDKKVVLILQIS